MPARKFKTKIEIVPKKSKQKYDSAVDLPTVEGQQFVDDVYAMLEKLDTKPSGKALLNSIEAAGKDVIIYKDDQSGAGSAALPYPGTVENETKRFIRLRQIPDAAITALKKHDMAFVPPSMQAYAAEVHKVLEASKVNRDIAATLIGLRRDDLDDIELGRKGMHPESYHRFAMAFYQWLTPGEGCSVALRFDSNQASDEDPAFIILGHELVHVWRMVVGMRVFQNGWEEEAMTTGLPPFMNMQFSENKLRAEHNKTIRTSYTALCGTGHYQTVITFRGIWPEHVKAWDQWKDANPKAGKMIKGVWTQNPVKVTKKSLFSSPNKHFLR